MVKKNLLKSLSVVMACMMAIMTVACGSNTVENKEALATEEEAKEIKMAMKDTTLNKLAKYVHKELGLYSLDCGYDINNEHCIDCMRRKVDNE